MKQKIWTRGVPMTEVMKLRATKEAFGSEFSPIILMKELYLHCFEASALLGQGPFLLSECTGRCDGVRGINMIHA